MTSKTPAMLLQELSTKKTGRGPAYQLITQDQGTHENLFEYIVDVLGVTATGRGRSKKEAKQETAKNALLMLNEQYNMDCVPPNLAQSSQQLSPDCDGELRKVVNYIGDLDDICAINELPEVQYELIFDSGPPHQKIFTFEGRMGHSIVERSTASTKKQARQNVAKQILERIEGIVPPLGKELIPDQLELCDTDQEVIDRYMEQKFFRKPNMNMKISDYYMHLRKYLEEKCVPIEDIKEQLEAPHTEEKLRTFLKKADLELEIVDMTEEGSKNKIFAYTVNTYVPICTMGMDHTPESAKEKALQRLFEHISVLTGLQSTSYTDEENYS